MISPPSPLLWATITVFLAAGIASILVALAGYFVQKRPFLVPFLIFSAGVADVAFAFKYAQLVVPGFPGGPIPSADVRLFFLFVGIASLMFPIGFYIAGDRELRLIREHAQEMEAKRNVAHFEKQKLEEKLEVAYAQNAERHKQFEELKRLIITNVRHELQTPMSIILGYIDMIIQGTFGAVVDPLRQPLATVHSNARRMSFVVERMVNTWRDPVFLPTDMAIIGRQLVDDVDIWLNTRRNPADVTITTDIPAKLPVMGDTEMLKTAVLELLNNAIKFGGTQIHLEMFEQDGEIVTQVRDNGIGISRKYHRQIFEPLFQIQMGLSRQYEGAGMGLAVVAWVAQAHDGHTFVVSRLGQGATFTFVVPKAQVAG